MGAARKVLFSAVKNEAPFLLEWIAYHRAIGFDRFLIVSNDSDDGTTELLDALHAQGIVHHIHHSVGPDESPQGKAALAANASGLIADGDWVIWLDADEFLNIHAGAGTVDDLIAVMGDAFAMLIPWRLFGDGGNEEFPGRFISTNFAMASDPIFPLNGQVKTFYRFSREGARPSHKSPHRPRLARDSGLTNADVVNASGLSFDLSHDAGRRWLNGVDSPANAKIAESDFSWKLAQINHYAVRTPDLFRLKRRRGRGYRSKRKIVGIRHTDKFFVEHNRNDVRDETILRHRIRTDVALAELLAFSDVQRALDDVAARLAANRETGAAIMVDSAVIVPADLVPPAPPAISMPQPEADLLASLYARHDVILEYGTGGSTRLAASQAHSLVMGVESDRAWAEDLEAGIRRDYPEANLRLHWVDVGPTGKWGRPRNDSGWRGYHLYPLSVWDQPWFRHPDLVLVDGRFRVGCLLATLFRITRPVTLLFDDYADRPHYAAAVEPFVRPVSVTGRMARFELQPTAFPVERLTEITGLMSLPD